MASYRKSKLNDNSAFLQFNWKADVVESWIGRHIPPRNLFVLFHFEGISMATLVALLQFLLQKLFVFKKD